jgi:class 3 adenylate cyclase
MATKRIKRKISAILSADVFGYSRLMGDDEATTVQTLESYRETISSLIQQYNGHVVDSPGDNILSVFSSVVDSVQCAVEIQQIIKAKNSELPEKRKMEFRIGINLGDVIVEGKRIYGDGVNIAARIEALADPGGICISGSAYEQIETKLALGYENLGNHTLKNISRPIRIYKIPIGTRAATETEKEEWASTMPTIKKGMQLDNASADKLVIRESGNPESYYAGGFVCLAICIGFPILGYCIGRIKPEAFFPLAGIGVLVGLIGISLILFGKLLDRREKAVKKGNHLM